MQKKTAALNVYKIWCALHYNAGICSPQVLRNGDLIIRGISWVDDMGEFKCVASNQFGNDEAITFLYPALVRI